MDMRKMRKALKTFLADYAARDFERFQYEFFIDNDIENPSAAMRDRLFTVLAKIRGGLR